VPWSEARGEDRFEERGGARLLGSRFRNTSRFSLRVNHHVSHRRSGDPELYPREYLSACLARVPLSRISRGIRSSLLGVSSLPSSTPHFPAHSSSLYSSSLFYSTSPPRLTMVSFATFAAKLKVKLTLKPKSTPAPTRFVSHTPSLHLSSTFELELTDSSRSVYCPRRSCSRARTRLPSRLSTGTPSTSRRSCPSSNSSVKVESSSPPASSTSSPPSLRSTTVASPSSTRRATAGSPIRNATTVSPDFTPQSSSDRNSFRSRLRLTSSPFFSLFPVYACKLRADPADAVFWRTAEMELIRKYLVPHETGESSVRL